MTDRILKLRDLNWATLKRQMLLKREPLPVLAAVQRLVGMQAQLPVAPYVGLWTRLHKFSREDLQGNLDARDAPFVLGKRLPAVPHNTSADAQRGR